MSLILKIALDAVSARMKDADGRLHISTSHISKAAVNPYYGREIPGYLDLGLEPDKVYRMLRHPDELAKGAHTFARLPILGKHIIVSAKDPQHEHIVGAIGSNVVFNDPYLDADLCYWDADAIDDIESDRVREHSCAYRYTPVMTPGVWQGQEYDGVMTEIIGNHLAQVEAGRAGSDCLAADEDITMKMTKLGKALFLTLGGMSPKMAADSALAGLVAKASKKNPVDAAKIVAMDSELDAEKVKKTIAAVVALDEEKEKKEGAEDEDDDDDAAEDEDDDKDDKDKKEKAAKDKATKDKAAKDEEKKENEKAMDAKIADMKQGLKDAEEARRLVLPTVGAVITQDSAEEIYEFALDQMKVSHKDVKGVPALRALYTTATARPSAPASVAMDHAATATAFPGLSRFSHQ